jgi:hypothetical protein
VPDSGIRLPPWVIDGKALIGPWMKDSGLREPGVSDPRDPFPSHAVLLAAAAKRALPEDRDVVSKRTECPRIRGHRVIRKEACHHGLELPALVGDGFVHALT